MFADCGCVCVDVDVLVGEPGMSKNAFALLTLLDSASRSMSCSMVNLLAFPEVLLNWLGCFGRGLGEVGRGRFLAVNFEAKGEFIFADPGVGLGCGD